MGLLDLSKFQKVSEDKKMTVLKHKDGHEIKIIHDQLPRIQREQLKFLKLVDMGESKARKKMASGGVAHYDEGTKDQPVSQDDAQPTQDTPDASPVSPDQSHTTNVYVNASPGQQAGPPPPPSIQPGQSLQRAAPSPVNVPQVGQGPSTLLPDKSMSAPGVAQTLQETAQTGGQIEAQRAKAQADYEQQYLKSVQQKADIDAQNFAELKGHTDDFRDYLQQHAIDPNHYMESRGTGQKVANAIGLFLGGLGGGMLGTGGNVALDYMNKQIDRDIDAQKSRSDQAKTIWGAYHQLYGDSNVANNLAKVSMNDMLVHQANLTAAQLGTASALNNAKALGAQKAIENNKLILDSSGRLGSTPNAPAGAMNPIARNQPAVGPNLQANPVASNASGNPFSLPQGEAAIPPKEASINESSDDHLLIPNHVQALKNLAYTPKAKDELGAIQAQYNQAVQAEKGLGQIHGTFNELASAAEKSGELGNLRRHFVPDIEKLPFGVGEVIGAPAKYITDTPSNRAYDSAKSNLIGFISSALKGTNIGAGQIQEIVDANSPEAGDSPKMIAKKENTIREFIKNHTDTSLLKKWDIAK